jgi:hypothetical protein
VRQASGQEGQKGGAHCRRLFVPGIGIMHDPQGASAPASR